MDLKSSIVEVSQSIIIPPANVQVSVRIYDVGAEPNSVYPTLRFNVEFATTGLSMVTLTNLNGRLFVRANQRYFLGYMNTDNSVITIGPSSSRTVAFYTSVDYTGLAAIERFRGNQDLNLEIILSIASIPLQSQQNFSTQVSLQYRIPKSDWVETLLASFQFRQTFLFELPRISESSYKETSNYLDEAMKKLAMGDYPEVLVQCQKTLEKAKEIAKSKGALNAGDIDFKKLIPDSENASDSLDTIWRKLVLFLQGGGRHIGRGINREDAEFAVLVTYSLVNLLVKNTP